MGFTADFSADLRVKDGLKFQAATLKTKLTLPIYNHFLYPAFWIFPLYSNLERRGSFLILLKE